MATRERDREGEEGLFCHFGDLLGPQPISLFNFDSVSGFIIPSY